MAQRQRFADQRGVVELDRVAFGLIARARHVRPVHALTQRAAARELHHRQVAGHLERELVAVAALGLGSGAGGGNYVPRYTIELISRHVQAERIGCVECVLAELLPEFGLALLDLRKALLGFAGEVGARQHKVAAGVLQRLLLFGSQRGFVDGFVLGIQAFVCPKPRPELGDAGQGCVVGGAQLGCVGHCIEVADRAPGARQALGADIQLQRDRVPLGRKVGLGHAFEGGIGLSQQMFHRFRHLLGRDAVKQREIGEIKKCVAHAAIVRHKTDACSRDACLQAIRRLRCALRPAPC